MTTAWLRYLKDKARKWEAQLRAEGKWAEQGKDGVCQVGVHNGQIYAVTIEHRNRSELPVGEVVEEEEEGPPPQAPPPPQHQPILLRVAAALTAALASTPAAPLEPELEHSSIIPVPRQIQLGPMPEITVATFVNGRPGIKRIEAPPPQPRCVCEQPVDRVIGGCGVRCARCGGQV